MTTSGTMKTRHREVAVAASDLDCALRDLRKQYPVRTANRGVLVYDSSRGAEGVVVIFSGVAMLYMVSERGPTWHDVMDAGHIIAESVLGDEVPAKIYSHTPMQYLRIPRAAWADVSRRMPALRAEAERQAWLRACAAKKRLADAKTNSPVQRVIAAILYLMKTGIALESTDGAHRILKVTKPQLADLVGISERALRDLLKTLGNTDPRFEVEHQPRLKISCRARDVFAG